MLLHIVRFLYAQERWFMQISASTCKMLNPIPMPLQNSLVPTQTLHSIVMKPLKLLICLSNVVHCVL